MFNNITQYYLRTFRPKLNALITKLVYSSKRIEFGKGFKTDSIPKILVDKNCKLIIGDNVEFRRNIEIRSHGTSVINIGNNVRIDRGVRILAANNSKIEINEGVRIGLYSVFNGGDSITVKEKSLISGFVYLQTSMHGYADKNQNIQNQGYLHQPITIEKDAWLGTHVVVLPGVTIGSGAVVGSNAVVTKSVNELTIVAGVPAKILKER